MPHKLDNTTTVTIDMLEIRKKINMQYNTYTTPHPRRRHFSSSAISSTVNTLEVIFPILLLLTTLFKLHKLYRTYWKMAINDESGRVCSKQT
jgi:hypothetical protein